MIIDVLEQGNTKVVETIEIAEIDTSRITPVNAKVADPPIPIQELSDLITQIQPVELLKPEEPDTYYAQNIEAWRDGNLSREKIDIPHHIGLRVLLTSILQKYGISNRVLIQIT